MGPPGVLGIWGEWLFIFRDLRSTGNYFRGAGEQAHSFGDLGSPARKQKNKGKASILFDFFKKESSASGGIAPQTPLLSSNSNHFRMACTCTLSERKIWQLSSVVVDLVTLKVLIFRMVITYFGTPRLHQTARFLSKFSRGNMPPDPTSMSVPLYCYRATYAPAM